MCNFYEKLYKSNNINVSDLQDYLKDTHIENILSDAEKDINSGTDKLGMDIFSQLKPVFRIEV